MKSSIRTLLGTMVMAGAMLGLPHLAAATIDGYLDASSAVGQPVTLTLTITPSGAAATNVTAQAWVPAGAAISAPTPASYASVADGVGATFKWTATPTASGSLTFTATATGDGPDSSPPSNAIVAVPAAALAAQLTFSKTTVGVGSTVNAMLTVTNTGGVLVTNLVGLISVAGPGFASAPNPLQVAAFAPGARQVFTWTISPSGGGSLFMTAYGLGDNPITSPVRSGSVAVPAPALDARLTISPYITISSTISSVSGGMKGVVLTLTVTNTGGSAATNVKAGAWAWSSTVTGTAPATVASLPNSGTAAKTTFSWTVTPTALGLITFTATATADGGILSPAVTVSATVILPALMTATLTATSSTPMGGNILVMLTVGNNGTPGINASAKVDAGWSASMFTVSPTVTVTGGVATTVTAYNVAGTGLPKTIAPGQYFTFSWTITAGMVASTVSFSGTIYLTDSNGGPTMANLWVKTGPVVVAPTPNLASKLTATRTSTLPGKPVTFTLLVTNGSAMSIVNLVPILSTESTASIGTPSPASVVLLAPYAKASFTWTVTPADSRELRFSAMASGTARSASGDVTVSTPWDLANLPGIPLPEAKAAFAFPSPARDTTQIGYLMAEPGTALILVYTVGGTLAATVEEVKAAGVQSSALTTKDLAPGVYYILLKRTYDSGTVDKADLAKFAVVH